MKINRTIYAKLTDGKLKAVEFGQPDLPEEMEAMFRFRHDEYLKRGYISPGFYPDGRDFDELDAAGKCAYFFARVDGRIIGTVRLIMDEYLPTEKECFKFVEPPAIQKIPRSQRAELGRLIAAKYSPTVFLPRHLVMLGMFLNVYDYCRKKRIRGGYSFIKDSLKKKLEKLWLPVGIIRDNRQIYQGEVLKNYFSDPQNPVWPIYYTFGRLGPYFFLLRLLLLKKKGEKEFFLRQF